MGRGRGLSVARWARAAALGAAVVAGALSGAVAGAELAHVRASKRLLGDHDGGGSCGIIVLGFPPRHDGRVHPIARWRVQMTRRAALLLGPEVVVFSGGGRPGRPTEASIMAQLAVAYGVRPAIIKTEERSTSTRENIAFSLPLVEHCDRLAVVSDPMHASRARRQLVAQRPDLAPRLVSAGEYVRGEKWWLKVPTAGYELGRHFGARSAVRARSSVRDRSSLRVRM